MTQETCLFTRPSLQMVVKCDSYPATIHTHRPSPWLLKIANDDGGKAPVAVGAAVALQQEGVAVLWGYWGVKDESNLSQISPNRILPRRIQRNAVH